MRSQMWQVRRPRCITCLGHRSRFSPRQHRRVLPPLGQRKRRSAAPRRSRCQPRQAVAAPRDLQARCRGSLQHQPRFQGRLMAQHCHQLLQGHSAVRPRGLQPLALAPAVCRQSPEGSASTQPGLHRQPRPRQQGRRLYRRRRPNEGVSSSSEHASSAGEASNLK